MYAKEHDIIYNAKKTKCICIRPKSMIDMCDPVFMLGNECTGMYTISKLCWGWNHVHNVEIQCNKLYSRGEMITSKFRNCSESIKCRLFPAFCTTIYCSSICSGFRVESMCGY